MKTVLFYFGRFLQLAGMATVVVAFLSFYSAPLGGEMMRLVFLGLIEFYIGYFMATSAGKE